MNWRWITFGGWQERESENSPEHWQALASAILNIAQTGFWSMTPTTFNTSLTDTTMELSLPQIRNQLLPLLNRERSHGYTIVMDYPASCLWLVKGEDKKLLVNREEINAGLWNVAAVRISRVIGGAQ